MKTAFVIIQIVLSLILIALIFLQSKSTNENSLLSENPPEKRGWEKVTFNLTIVITLLFLVSSLLLIRT